MKAIWKGHIRFSLVTIPILVYNAVDTEQTIRFNLLHKMTMGLSDMTSAARSAIRF